MAKRRATIEVPATVIFCDTETCRHREEGSCSKTYIHMTSYGYCVTRDDIPEEEVEEKEAVTA
jgi:hypothetical protein